MELQIEAYTHIYTYAEVAGGEVTIFDEGLNAEVSAPLGNDAPGLLARLDIILFRRSGLIRDSRGVPGSAAHGEEVGRWCCVPEADAGDAWDTRSVEGAVPRVGTVRRHLQAGSAELQGVN
ncbi:hypothetical protein [Sorangium cellulosum]|uniref:hypothetical protein n=1 Tax=Sorangium cellulosum TaxID=56 RepID=UPI0012FFB801|nr:hypothetical protein [Sorangium cellulosum]